MALKQTKHFIKAVTFDLWETLIFERDGYSSRRMTARYANLSEALKTFGLEFTIEQLHVATDEMISSLVKVWNRNEDVTCKDQIRLIIEAASKNKIILKNEWIDDLYSAYVSPIVEIPPYLNPDAREIFAWLKDRHMRIGLICNTGLTPGTGLRRLLADEGVIDFFDIMLFSDEVGIRKPDLGIFQLATQKLKVKPCEAIHVGDNLKADVWGAKNAGWKAIFFQSQVGRDREAEADARSLVSLSRRLGNLEKEQAKPDKTVTSLSMLAEAVEELEIA